MPKLTMSASESNSLPNSLSIFMARAMRPSSESNAQARPMATAALSKSRDFSVEGGEDRVVTAQHIRDGKRAGEEVNTTTETIAAERTTRAFFVSDGVYAVEFHFASMLSPPFTFCPRFTTTCDSRGSHTSTREPKRIRPTRSPSETSSPSCFQHITRRAIAPAICLKTKHAGRRVNGNDVLFVFAGGSFAHRGVKTARAVNYTGDAPGHRRALHVYVPDGKKNSDATAHAGVE